MTASTKPVGNKYYIIIRYKDSNGKWHAKWQKTDLSTTKPNKRKLEQKRLEVLEKFKEEFCIEDNKMLFSAYLRDWLKTIKHTIAESTYRIYTNVIEGVICPYFEERKITLGNLKASDIQEFYNIKMDEGISGNTIWHYHANIHKALKYAVKTERIKNNPADNVDLPKKKKHIADFLSAEELNTLLQAAMGTKIETVVLLASWFGLRRGEILGLKWDCIDFRNRLLTIKGTIVLTDKMEYRDSTKTCSSIRTLPMPEDAVTYLQNLKEKQAKDKVLYGKKYDATWDGFVCVDSKGHLLTLDYVSRQFPKLCEKCGLRRIKLHELRHTNISLLMNDGASLKEVQIWAGHSSYSTTADIYAHVQTKNKEKMAQSINKLVSLPSLESR